MQVTSSVTLPIRMVRSIRCAACSGGHAVLHVPVRHVREQAEEVDFLHVAAAEGHAHLLTGGGRHGLVIELGLVEPVE